MSRRYCSVCGEKHENKSWGMCDKHMQEEEDEKNDAAAEEESEFQMFMAKDEEDRWRELWEKMR